MALQSLSAFGGTALPSRGRAASANPASMCGRPLSLPETRRVRRISPRHDPITDAHTPLRGGETIRIQPSHPLSFDGTGMRLA